MYFEAHDDTGKMAAAKLATLLSDDIKVSPLVLDGKNAAEKTDFIRKFTRFLDEQKAGFKCVYIDASESEGNRIAMMSFLADLAQNLPEKDREAFYRAAECLMRLVSEEKELLNNYLRRKSLNSLVKAVSDAKMEALLKKHLEAQRNIRIIRDILEKYTADTPVLVFIDGLDICTADFVVKILIAIDIVFRVNNMQFVLLADMGHLSGSVSSFYGASVNPAAYLERMTGFCLKFGPSVSKEDDLLARQS
ncbi:KAP family NTPase [Oxalobacter sp. OttesenSCG-928-P03]|nr:KAP family NTPase [Oxalobacter sp. OttesenSCG-928-P03]